MWLLFWAFTLSAVAANPLSQKVTPGSILQMATTPLSQKVTPGSILQMATTPLSQGVTPGSILQKATPGLQQPISNSLNIDQYLRKYGYMNDVNELSEDYDQHKTDAIKLFQRFASLPVTGITDNDTVKQMLKPRCGIKDINVERPSNARWNVTEFTYRFRSYTKDISQNNVRRAFVDGLSPWAAPSKLRFREITAGIPIMEVKFVNRRHPPCSVKMDGPGGVLAHAFFPSGHHEAGDMHLDDAETYKYKEGAGYELSSIVLHESGHALGLDHDYIFGSIMMPWYTGQTTLGPNDIKRIKELYA